MDKQNFGMVNASIFDQSTESEDSSSSSNPYKTQPFILEVHEISKDSPNPENVKKIKKTKKKKKNRSQASVSSESSTNSVAPVPAVEEQPHEEFYDAHESYHALPDTQISNPVAVVAVAQAHSEHGQDPKILDSKGLNSNVQESATNHGQTSEAQKQPSAITKPVTRTE